VLAPQRTSREPLIKYGPENLLDGKYTTAWVPDTLKSINGIGETLAIELAEGQSASGVQILNGYRKNFDIYTKNSRVKQMEIILSDGRRQMITLSDTDLSPQAFQFHGGPARGWIQLKIVAVYPGTKYQDTGITEVRVISAVS
jgi:hypothetical protein